MVAPEMSDPAAARDLGIDAALIITPYPADHAHTAGLDKIREYLAAGAEYLTAADGYTVA